MAQRRIFCKVLYFRHWSRRKTAILASLSRTIKICTLCLAYGMIIKTADATAQADSSETYATARELEEIEVVGQGSTAVFSGISRAAISISAADIDRAGIRNLADVLEYAANIDIRQRGNEGIQADAGIRGGTFDQVLILLNGIMFNDPQTGHVSLDLPVDMEVVDRIEVLQGPAARRYGPVASAGAVNIITREPAGNAVSASLVAGSYRYGRALVTLGYAVGAGKGMLSLGHARSEGYAENTDFNLQNIYFRHHLEEEAFSLDLQTGFQHKKFGANGFYTPRFPGQMEEADIITGSLKAETGGKIRITPLFYWRQRHDHFVLVRENPGFYQNFHRTSVTGSQLRYSLDVGNLSFTGSVGLRSEHIISNSLGYESDIRVKIRGEDSLFYNRRYERSAFSYSQEIAYRHANIDLSGGIMLYWNTAYPGRPEVFPGLDVSYRIFRTVRLYASYNHAGNLPTFTDLFYTDPDNQGNRGLVPADIRSYEAGFRYAASHSSGSIGFFRSIGHDVISWQWSYGQSRFMPVNLMKYDVAGMEAEFHADFSGWSHGSMVLHGLTLAYTWMHTSRSMADSVSKYDNLRHKLAVTFRHALFGNTGMVWRFSYQDRNGGYVTYDPESQTYAVHDYEPFFLADLQFLWERNGFSAFAEVSNLLGTRYVDAGSLQQPGRWLKAGIRVTLTAKDR